MSHLSAGMVIQNNPYVCITWKYQGSTMHRVKPYEILFLFLLLFSVPVYSRQKAADAFRFRHLSVDQGLSQSNVNCILQDSRGLLWFGTSDGLNSYDGYRFRHFKHQPGDTNSLSAPYVLNLFEDKKGLIWICTEGGGLNVFNPATESFRIYRNQPGNNHSISSNRVSAVCHDTGNVYWVSTFGGGLNIFNSGKGTFQHVTLDDDPEYKSSAFIISMIRARNGDFFLATKGGLYVLNSKGKVLKKYRHDPSRSGSIADNRLQRVYEDKKGNIWICTFNAGVYRLDPVSGSLVQFRHNPENPDSPAADFVNTIMEDSGGRIWMGTHDKGISVYDPASNSFTQLDKRNGDPYSLSSSQIQVIFEDRQQIIWIGSNGGGLNLYHPAFSYFTGMNTVWLSTEQQEIPNIYSITADEEENLWMGSNGSGLWQWNKDRNLLRQYRNNPAGKNTLSSNAIWALLPYKNTLIAGTRGQGLAVLERSTGRFTQLKHDSLDRNTPGSDNILGLFKENDSSIWIGTLRTGISIWNPVNGSFKHYFNSGKNQDEISSNIVYTIFKSRNGNIYAGTQGGGLNMLLPGTSRFKTWKNKPDDPYSLSSNDVQYICEDNKGILWLGTNGGGLNAFNPLNGKSIHFTERDGLPDNVVYAICDDRHGNLWLSTNKGICRFTPPDTPDFNTRVQSGFHATNFTVTDGLSASEFNQGACYQDRNGMVYFGSIRGLTSFHPDSVRENKYSSPVLITDFKVFEKPYELDTSIRNKKVITLSYFQDFFSFEFAGLNYLMPEKNTYAVMMDGFDRDWVHTGTRRYVSYTNLNPGTYTFKVKAANNDGVWSDNVTTLELIITPPFWKTWWFTALLLSVFLLSVYTIYAIRIRQIKKQEEQKTAFNKELAEVEMKALRAQMNPHFIFNSLNSINKYIWSNDQRQASDYLTRFSKLIRLILENSRHPVITLDKDLEALELYMQMESLRFEQHFEYTVELGDDVETESLLIPPLLLQPFVENSIWHGLMPKETPGSIRIKISIRNEALYCIVEDNGVGRERAKEIREKKISKHTSLGMKVTMDRIQMLNQQKNRKSQVTFTDLYDENGVAAGTRVELSVPLEYSF